MAADDAPLHVFFLPFPAAGHSIPMLDVAALFASRGATSTVVLLRADDDNSANSASNSNRCGGGDNDDNVDRLRFLSLPFSYAAAGIAAGEAPLPSAYATPEFEAALDAVGDPFLELLKAHRPDCVVADLLIPFAAEHAAALAIPHLTLQVTCAFSLIVMGIITHAKPHLGVASPSEPFVVPGLPHRIELTPAQLPSHLTAPAAAERNRRILAAQRTGGGEGEGGSGARGGGGGGDRKGDGGGGGGGGPEAEGQGDRRGRQAGGGRGRHRQRRHGRARRGDTEDQGGEGEEEER